MNSLLPKDSKRNLLIATSIVGGVNMKDCELISVFIQEILLLNSFQNSKVFPLTTNAKLPKFFLDLSNLPFLLYTYSMKNATKSTKSFFYELPQHMRSPIDDYFLIIISNSELEFDERISNLKKLHPNILSFLIQIGPVQSEYQNMILKYGFEGRFYLKKYTELRDLVQYVRKTFSQNGKGIAEMIEFINKFSIEHSDRAKSPSKQKTTIEKGDTNKHHGIVFVVDSGLEFLGNFIDKVMEQTAVRYELMSITEIKKVDFDCNSLLIFFNSSALLDPKKPVIIDQLLTIFGAKMRIAYFECPSSSITENGFKVNDDKVHHVTVFYEKRRSVQTYPVNDEVSLPMHQDDVSLIEEFIKSSF